VIKRSAFCVLLSAEAVVCAALGCDPSVVIGRYPAAESSTGGGTVPEAGMPDAGTGGRAEAGTGGGGNGGTPPLTMAGGAGEGGSGGEPEPSTLLWTANHESGDFSEWEVEGGTYGTDDPPLVSDARAHSGQYSLDFTIDTADRETHVMRAYRATVPEPAYYSAWFFLEEVHDPVEWWAIFVVLSATDLQDESTLQGVWDLNLRNRDGVLYPYIYDHLIEDNMDEGVVPVPTGEWVHLELYFAYAPPDSTEMRLWVNGELAFDLSGLGEVPGPLLAFSLGNGSDGLTPDVSTIYVDDAAISTERLGPQ
jgi:hypothetical protein